MRLFINLALIMVAAVIVNVIGDFLLKAGVLRSGSQRFMDFLNYVPPQDDEGVSYTTYNVAWDEDDFNVTHINRWGS